MKNKILIFLFILLVSLSALFFSCENADEKAPEEKPKEEEKLSTFCVKFKDGTMVNTEKVFTLSEDKTQIVSLKNEYNDKKGDIVSIIIPNSVTKINDAAFIKFSSLESVTLSSSLVAIGDYAFEECSSLEKIDFPKTLESLGKKAFNGCSLLKVVTISEKVSSMGENVFSNCASLKEIKINQDFDESTFSSYVFPEGVKITWKSSAVDLSDGSQVSVKTIFNISQDGKTLLSINDEYKDKIEEISLPSSIEAIENDVFSSCKNLKNIYIDEYEDISRLSSYSFPAGLSVSFKAYSIILVDNTRRNKDEAFTIQNGGLCLKDEYKLSVKKVFIPEDITSISTNAFKDCSNLEDVDLKNVIEIGEASFKNCTSLESVKLENVVIKIGKEAFSSSALKTLALPSSLVTLGENAFSSCSNLTKIYIDQYEDLSPLNNYNFPQGADVSFKAYSIILVDNTRRNKDEAFTITGNELTSIKDDFKASVKKVFIPEDITSISTNAFKDCSNLEDVDLKNVIEIGEASFKNCTALASVVISENVTNIGDSAFSGCSSLSEFDFKNVQSIGEEAFKGTALSGVFLPSSVSTLGSDAFLNCSSLEVINIDQYEDLSTLSSYSFPSGVKASWIVDYVILKNQNRVKLNEAFTLIQDGSEVSSVNDNYKNSIEKLVISKKITLIDDDAFSALSSLTEFVVSADNSSYSVEDGILFNKDKTTLVSYPRGKNGNVYDIPFGVRSVGSYAFSGNNNIEKINVGVGVSEIKSNAFSSCSSLIEVRIGQEEEVSSLSGKENTWGLSSGSKVIYTGFGGESIKEINPEKLVVSDNTLNGIYYGNDYYLAINENAVKIVENNRSGASQSLTLKEGAITITESAGVKSLSIVINGESYLSGTYTLVKDSNSDDVNLTVNDGSSEKKLEKLSDETSLSLVNSKDDLYGVWGICGVLGTYGDMKTMYQFLPNNELYRGSLVNNYGQLQSSIEKSEYTFSGSILNENDYSCPVLLANDKLIINRDVYSKLSDTTIPLDSPDNNPARTVEYTAPGRDINEEEGVYAFSLGNCYALDLLHDDTDSEDSGTVLGLGDNFYSGRYTVDSDNNIHITMDGGETGTIESNETDQYGMANKNSRAHTKISDEHVKKLSSQNEMLGLWGNVRIENAGQSNEEIYKTCYVITQKSMKIYLYDSSRNDLGLVENPNYTFSNSSISMTMTDPSGNPLQTMSSVIVKVGDYLLLVNEVYQKN